MDTVFRLAPFQYIHVLDVTTSITRVEEGPQTFIRQDNEQVVAGPVAMLTIPPRHYLVVANPVKRTSGGELVFSGAGDGETTKGRQVMLRHAELEIRGESEPFPLHPGEEVSQGLTPLTIVEPHTALQLRAIRDFEEDGVSRCAGDEWHFEGPSTYMPRVEVRVVETARATIILQNQALLVRARKETKDCEGSPRVTGAQWLVKTVGAYLPGVFEVVDRIVDAVVLTDKKALHVRATKNFTDGYGRARRTGDEWLITVADTDAHITAVEEEIVGEVEITVLTNRQYAVVRNPWNDSGEAELGARRMVKGPTRFFLRPGEELEDDGVQDFFVLAEDEGLVIRANEAFTDGDAERKPGDKWMIRGPAEYVPSIEVQVLKTHKAIPLDDNEGIYVRDVATGRVKVVSGKTYMLTENEEPWEKELPLRIDELLAESKDPLGDRATAGRRAADGGGGGKGGKQQRRRDKSRAVTFRVPHNACVQIYDYKAKQARVVFGPELVMLGSEEQFTMLSLSGGKPKRQNEIHSLCLLMGPDFCTDIIEIETADHARLKIQLSYNWHFEVDREDPEAAARLFSVPDFVGDMCKAVASRVRGAVASVQFDDFHKNSAKIIRTSVFGVYSQDEADKGAGEAGKVRGKYDFEQNGLCITSIDIQSAEPVDQRTRDALQKSVQLAIEITTNSQEATAKHEAQRLEQEAKGKLERQKIMDEAQAESSRQKLLELQAVSSAVESSGQAKAEALSRAEAAQIEGEAAVKQAQLKAEALKIEAASELERVEAARAAELKYLEAQDAIELSKAKQLMEIERTKFSSMVEAIGSDTLMAMAQAGPEMQCKLLKSLGLQSTLITDGKSPINLFQTAQGLIGGGGGSGGAGGLMGGMGTASSSA